MQTAGWRRVLRAGWTTWFAPASLAVWLLVFTCLLFRRHDTFQTYTYDQAYYTQIAWNTAHGHWFASSVKPPSYLADHFSPLLGLVAPLFWIFPDARALLLVKVATLAFSIVPAYALLRSRHPVLAPGLVLAFLFNPLLYRTVVNTGDFHEILLAAPTLALTVYALQRQRLRLLLAALALTC